MARMKKHDDLCQQLAEQLHFYATEDVRRCPECGEVIALSDCEEREEDPEGLERLHKCPECGEWIDWEDAEEFTAFDYVEDALGLSYVISSSKQYEAARVMLAWGGPAIYADTLRREIELYWWSESGSAELSSAACDWLDSACEELCLQDLGSRW